MTARPLFITFEGPEGSGKSTQLQLVAERLRSCGRTVVETREPGGTRIGTQIRRVLLDPGNTELSALCELLLMFASRAQNVEECIRPALAHGSIVLSDRFIDSTVAYQGGARGLSSSTIHTLDQLVCDGLTPDVTFLIDIETELGLARAGARNAHQVESESRLDDEEVSFHRKVRAAFKELASQNAHRIHVIDGSGSVDDVAEAIWRVLEPIARA